MEEEQTIILPEGQIRRTGHSAPDILSNTDNPTHLQQMQELESSLHQQILLPQHQQRQQRQIVQPSPMHHPSTFITGTVEQVCLPLKKDRRKTDILCTIINTGFVLILFLILVYTFNLDNLKKITYPNDSEGKLCGYDLPNYPYLYFTSLTDSSKRLCVSKCPTERDETLICKPTSYLSCHRNNNPKYEVIIYDTYLDDSRIGLFCFPTDQKLKNQILSISGIQNKYNFMAFYDSMWRSIWISVLFGIASFLLIHFRPYQSVFWTILLGSICSISFGLLILILADGYLLVKLLLSVFFIGLGVMSGLTLYVPERKESVFLCARMIHAAAITQEKKEYLQLPPFTLEEFKKLAHPFLIIISFIALFLGFLVLIGFQILSAWSIGELTFQKHYPFYQIQGINSNILQIVIFFQLVWGMSFLKQAFNYIVSGYAAEWYFSRQAAADPQEIDNVQNELSYLKIIKIGLQYHWGSVIGGSFMLGLFYFVDLILDFIYPDSKREQNRENVNEVYPQFTLEQASTSRDFFNLIRSQSFAYIHLTGVNYCTAARTCDALSYRSDFYNLSQTTNRIFRINQHMIPIFITLLIALISMKNAGNASPYGILFITVITFFTVTYFLAYHGDKAEGVLISTYVDEQIGYGICGNAPEIVKKAIKNDKDNTYMKRPLWDDLFDSDSNPQ